jgi:hypothetical protein
LDGEWRFTLDPDARGLSEGWHFGYTLRLGLPGLTALWVAAKPETQRRSGPDSPANSENCAPVLFVSTVAHEIAGRDDRPSGSGMIVEINPATDNLIEATDWNQPPDVLSRLVEFVTNTLVII